MVPSTTAVFRHEIVTLPTVVNRRAIGFNGWNGTFVWLAQYGATFLSLAGAVVGAGV
jgi:hypothetical protein